MTRSSPVSRRGMLLGGGLTAVGVGAGVAGATAAQRITEPEPPELLIDFHGPHQAGVETPPQQHLVLNAYDLRPETDREAARRMLTLVTDDSSRLTRAEPAINDQEPQLATVPARLTITLGFGPGWFDKLGLQQLRPTGLADLPAYEIDRLQPEMGDGDLLVQIGADDPTVLSHTARQLTKTIRGFAAPRWAQRGFTAEPRNLMGQVDGTVNPQAATDDFGAVVWSSEPGWFTGGTTMVFRRIRMQLDTWDELDAIGKELAVGRTLGTGAPLTGSAEHDVPDFAATDANGLPIIPPFSHVARAAPRHGVDRFLRRPYSYDDGLVDGTTDAGLLFCTFQADIATQYVPVQDRLAELDSLNDWTVPIGSGVYAIPPGCEPGGFIGEGLFG
ncbi:Dyp-type peroxidase [Microlunatus sp. Y2014]|uniref:Dyp-type peroxidase n=1 Tax=Microlunatus sp. Y2014 TaxID=3418488 RepID=UPI003DA6F51F